MNLRQKFLEAKAKYTKAQSFNYNLRPIKMHLYIKVHRIRHTRNQSRNGTLFSISIIGYNNNSSLSTKKHPYQIRESNNHNSDHNANFLIYRRRFFKNQRN